MEDSLADCTSTLRDLVATKNAIAGLLILLNEWGKAFAEYQTTLEFCRGLESKQGVKTDSFQVIHCLWNSLACCVHCPELLPAEKRTASSKELSQLETSFLDRTHAKLKQAESNLEQHALDLEELDVVMGYIRDWATRMNFNKEVVIGKEECKYRQEGCSYLFSCDYRYENVTTTDSQVISFMSTIQVIVGSRPDG